MSAKKPETHSRLALSTSIAVLCAGALAVAGCGGSQGSSSTPAASPQIQTVIQTPSQGNPDVGTAKAQRSAGTSASQGGHNARGRGAAVGRPPTPASSIGPAGNVQKARPDQNAAAKPVHPCKLVSRPEAQSIVGRAITASIEAPQGPTCIYQLSGSKSVITLQVESIRFAQVTHQLSKRTQVTVGAHKAYCGSLGTQMLFVPLTGARVLHVTASCAIARRLAALALSRLAV